jgi:hypothetical protein
MMETVENDPAKFHIKNRGIIYRCDKFEFDNAARLIRLTNPSPNPDEDADEPTHPVSVDSKTLTHKLSPLSATLTKNREGRPRRREEAASSHRDENRRQQEPQKR